MKPFDLEKALAGEPVMLRDGQKAYIKFEIPNELKEDNFADIVGFYVNGSEFIVKEWDSSGIARFNSPSEDIIGMWQEPRPRVQLDLPAPLKEPQIGMYCLSTKGRIFQVSCDGKLKYDPNLLERGRYFATKEDAQEWLDAMKNARR